MAIGKHLSLEGARKSGKLQQLFAKEHPSKGSEKAFDELFERMAKKEKQR